MNRSNRIIIGQYASDDNRLMASTLDYDGLSNGVLLGGITQTGKTNTLELLMYQLIIQYSARFMVADYQGGVTKSITPRLQPLVGNAILKPIAREGDEIEAMINEFATIITKRKNLEIPESEHYPLVLVVDEFITFADEYSPPDIKSVKKQGDLRITQQQSNYFTKMKTILNNCRRVNASVIIAGQTFITTKGLDGISIIRTIFKNHIIHRMTPNDLKSFNYDAKTMRVIGSLDAGYAWYNGRVVKVPLVMPNLKEAALSVAQLYKPVEITCAADTSQDDYLQEMLERYGNKKVTITSKEDIMRLLKYNAGLSYNQVKEYRLPGRDEKLLELYNSV